MRRLQIFQTKALSSYVKCETVGSCKLQSYVLRFFFFLIKFSGMFLAQKQLTIFWSFITAEFVLNGNFFSKVVHGSIFLQ